MSHTTMFRSLSVLTAALLVGVASQPVEARSVGAAVGVASSNQMPCVAYAFGTITNVCSGGISFDIPMPVDSGGNKRVGVDAFAPRSIEDVRCVAQGVTERGDIIFSSSGGYRPLPGIGAPVNITLDGAFVPGGGHLVANCLVGAGARVITVNWNQ